MTRFGRRIGAVSVTLAFIASHAYSASAQSQQESSIASGQADRIVRAVMPTKPQHPKIRGTLRRVLLTGGAQDLNLATAFPLAEEGLMPISIYGSGTNEIVAALASLGRTPSNVADGVVEAYVALGDLVPLAAVGAVHRLEGIERAVHRVVSEGRDVHNADAWIAGGHTGAGVKVGVIDSFDGILAQIGAELPQPAGARCYTSVGLFSSSLSACDTGSNHGTAVAESLVDVAPGVTLYIANPISKLDFINTIQWMTAQGVSVINYSAARPWDGPGDGTSPYADSPLVGVNAAVQGGAVFVTAAGNEGQSSWFGPWQDADMDAFQEFSGSAELNTVFLNAGERLMVQARWNDSWYAASRDIDLLIFDASVNLVASGTAPQSGTPGDTPFEAASFVAPYTGIFYIALGRYAGAAPSGIQVQAFSSQQIQFATAGGSIGNPAETANLGALAVGAAAWSTPAVIEPYSSMGPTPDGRVKPDIVGADRAATASYGASFPGTSQASPHVAGLAALVRQAFPAYTPAQTAQYLKYFAQPRGASPNNTWGAGFAHLPDLCSYVVSPQSAQVPASGGQLAINVTAGTGCNWGSVSNASWVTVVGGGAASGSGAVTLAVAANAGPARIGTATVAGTTITVSQAAPQIVAPTPPQNFRVSSITGNMVTLQWDAPATGPAPAGYLLEGGVHPGQVLASIPTGSTANTLSLNAPTGAFYIRMHSLSGSLRSAASNEIRIFVNVPAPPSAPANLLGLVNGSRLALSWTNTAGGGAPSHLLLTVTGSIATTLRMPVGEQFAFNGVPGGTYHFSVTAENGSGSSAPSNVVTLSFPSGCTGAPTMPVGVVVSRSGNLVSVAWSPPMGGTAVESYTLMVGGSFNGAFVTTGRQMAGTVGRGTYTISVAANNACGSSQPSEPQPIVVP